MPPVPPSRRQVLAGLSAVTAVWLLPGCTGDDGDDGPDAGRAPDPDLDLLARTIADKQNLLAAYAATTTRHPGLAARLDPMRADHAAHLAALTSFRSDVPVPEASASAVPTAPAVPADPQRAVTALASAEHSAAGRRVGQCEAARDRQLARLIASIGGSEAAHTAVLRAGS
ncbi:hypothetical protein GCM10009547_39750 [Sporichthya brevicatena]|uniref:Ferritin-like domain-containing protein n=1 Tax=Sporichthya brevicatena TaxID=171442 RepID=A0ABN1H7U1_9ACTN